MRFFYKAIIPISFLLTSPVYSAKTPAPTTNIQDASLLNIEYTSSDEKFARELIELSSSLRRNQKNTRAVKSLKNLTDQATLFDEFSPIIKSIDSIFSTTLTSKNFNSHCVFNQAKSNDTLSPVAQSLMSQIHSYCLKKFSEIKKDIEFSESEIGYIVRNIDLFLISHQLNGFIEMLESLKERDNSSYIKISEVITDHIVNNQVRPSSHLVEAINVNQRLTSYLQEIGHSDDNSYRFFTNEFNKLIDRSRDLAENNHYKEAIKVFDQALSFYSNNAHYISENVSSRGFLFIGQDLLRANKFEKAKYVYGSSMGLYRGSRHETFVFQLLWSDIIRDNYSLAEKNLHQLDILAQIETYDSRIQFWSARILEKQNKIAQASEIYGNLIENQPMSYYAILSTKNLTQIRPQRPEVQRFIASSISSPPAHISLSSSDYSPYFRQLVGRIGLWSDLEMGHWAHDEANFILSNKNINDFIVNENIALATPREQIYKQILKDFSTVFNHKGEYLQTFRLLNRAIRRKEISVADLDLSLLFPSSYIKQIQKTNSEIDPTLVLSLIRQESAFNPKAISSAGARGLMQLMPNTARMLHSPLRARDLEDTDLNIRLGIQYLTKRLNQYDGDLILTLASYNAGAHRVDRWRSEVFQNQDPLKIIESIPFRETRNYVKFIYRNMFFYQLMNEQIDLEKSIADSFRVSMNT